MRYFKCVGYKDKERLFTIGDIYNCNDDGRGMVNDNGFKYEHLDVNTLQQWYIFKEVTNKRNATRKENKMVRKFKCIKHYNPEYAEEFTVGKIYKCNELGQLVDNRGFGWGWLQDEDVEDFSRRADYFIERVKDCVKFEEVTSTPKITVKVEGRKTIACMWLNGKLIKKRFCVCHKDDEYDYAKGVEIAVRRLFDWDYERQHENECAYKINDENKIIMNDTYLMINGHKIELTTEQKKNILILCA